MIPTIIIAFISLIGLIILHELGHFILAKKFGVKVEEFGIGYPPRIFGKKFGETLYSINLLPFGAFVRMPGEIEKIEDHRSFSAQPIGKRILIVLGGVISFWLIAAILLSIVMGIGAPTAISDNDNGALKDVKVQIAAIIPGSSAEIAGMRIGDTISSIGLKTKNEKLKIRKVKEVQEFVQAHRGEEITLTIQRGEKVFDLKLIPRVSPPEGEGAMGVALIRTAIKIYPWWQAPWQGIRETFNLTMAVLEGWIQAIRNIIKGLPSGVQLMGPVGIFNLFTQVANLGVNYFLQFIAMISIYLALFNILPIPTVDGGKLLFLGIEAIRKKAISQKVEQNITAVFFALLIFLMVWITIKDIVRIF